MSVIVARTAGFCWGVRRAIDKVLNELKKSQGPFKAYGPIVHNPQVLEALRDRGVEECLDISRIKNEDGTLFLRTHGISVEELDILSRLPVKLSDLTCPRVARALALAGKYTAAGRDIIILGDADHAEVKALKSYACGKAAVIAGTDQIKNLPALEDPVLISQTTQNEKLFSKVVQVLQGIYPDLTVCNTICGSTDRRQEELRKLCPKVDCVVIVGGRSSANTKRLTSIASEEGLPAFQIETAEELDQEELTGFLRILLTAGASTPGWSIRKVREKLLEIQGSRKPVGKLMKFIRILVFTNIHLVLAAASIGAAGGIILDGFPWWMKSIPAVLTIYAIHTFNGILESGQSKFTALGRQKFIRQNRTRLFLISLISMIASLVISFIYGYTWFLIVFAVWILFGLYSMPLLVLEKTPISWFRTLPGSRDIMFAGTWSLLLAFLPHAGSGRSITEGSAWLWAAALFLLLTARSLILDLVDILGDAFVGRETIPNNLGIKKSKNLLYSCLLASGLIPLIGVFILNLKFSFLGFIASPLFVAIASIWLKKQSFPSEVSVRLVVDSGLFLAGALPLMLWYSEI